MSIYIHHNNSLIRNMRYLYKIRDFRGMAKDQSNNQITFDLSYIGVVRLREDSKQPCDLSLQNDDEKWMQTIWDVIGCVPPYWMLFHPAGKSLVMCSTSSELQQAAKYLPVNNELAVKRINQNYDPPCYRMRALANSNSDVYSKENIFKMKFRFRYCIDI